MKMKKRTFADLLAQYSDYIADFDEDMEYFHWDLGDDWVDVIKSEVDRAVKDLIEMYSDKEKFFPTEIKKRLVKKYQVKVLRKVLEELENEFILG